MDIKQLMIDQKAYFMQGNTKSYVFRMEALTRLEHWIKHNETSIMKALKDDLNKAGTESYFSEIGMVLSELKDTRIHLRKWMRNRIVRTPMAQFRASSYVMAEPYGSVLIMSPWNYPFMLSIDPLIGAIAAGNCVVIKPSAYAPATSKLIVNMVKECFDEAYITVVEGGRDANTQLLDQRFDLIFFTGSVTVGKLVMEKASRHLTPVILELGGKSPCIVDESAKVDLAARRIVFGKFLNSGQTCVAPDYVLVSRRVHKALVEALQREIKQAFGTEPLQNPELPKIINQHHFERLKSLILGEQVIGGKVNDATLQIEPTIIEQVYADSPCMQEEIFGPILPLMMYDEIDEAITYIQKHEKPLALYLFTESNQIMDQVMKDCSFGGGCINDTIIHLASSKLPFGGVGASGMGHYHGHYSFETFSHQKSIVKKATWIDIPLRYHPYTASKEKWIRKFMK